MWKIYENDTEMPSLAETKSIKIRYWNIMDDSLLKVNSVIYIKMTQKNQQPTKKNRWVTFPNKIPSTPSISSFFWRDPPAFPIYIRRKHQWSVPPPSGCHSAEHIQLSDLKTSYLGKVKDLFIKFWWFTQVYSIKKNTTHTQIHYRIYRGLHPNGW